MRLFFIFISLFIFSLVQAKPYNGFEGAYIGVQTKSISKAKVLGFENPNGSIIAMVYENTEAHRDSLQVFEYIITGKDYELGQFKILVKFDTNEDVTIHSYGHGKKKSERVRLDSLENRNFDFKEASEEANELRKSKKYDRAFLGVNYTKLSKKKAKKLNIDNPYGSYVTGVVPNTAADKAGVEVFDYIYGIDEYRVGESQSMGRILSKYKAGDAATLHLIRKGNIKKLDLTFGRKSNTQATKRNKCDDPFFGIQKSHKAPAKNGIRVSIVNHSTAKDLGLLNGDIITAINDYPMIDWEDISAAIHQLDVGETIKVTYERNGNKMQGSKAIKSYCDNQRDRNKDFEVDSDENDFDFESKENEHRAGRSARIRTLKGLDITLTAISSAEANKMQTQHGIKIPTINTLSINALKLYPNPLKGMCRLSFDLPQSGHTSICIYNRQGRKIYEYELDDFSGTFIDEVDILQNGEGAYFLEIRQDGKSKSQKIILQKS